MRPEEFELLLVKDLFEKSIEKKKVNINSKYEVSRITGDASTRRYFRLFDEANSYVVCLDNPIETGESSFIVLQKVLDQNKVRVPKVYDQDLERGYILEEDLGNVTFLSRAGELEDSENEYKFYQRSIDELLKIHSIDISNYKDYRFTELSFDYEKLYSEYQFSIKWFLDNFLKVKLSSGDRAELDKGFQDICKKISSKKMVLTHRDYHSRNLMIKGESDIIVIDFQDARSGIPQYDLVSLLEDCYYELDTDNKNKLKNYYFEKMPKKLLGQSKDEFEYYYQLTTLQRVFKAIGSFSYIYGLRSDVRYIKYIGFGMEKLKKTLYGLDEFSNLRKTLFSIYYGN